MDRTAEGVGSRAPRRPARRRGIALLVTLVIGTLAAIIPASPASAIQTIAWTQAPPATSTLSSTFGFAWSGTANTFLGARITGCFANFPDGNNYTRSFGGNFTTGNCNYANRLVTQAPSYPLTVGFYLSTGGQMTMTWNITVGAPTPTVYTSGNQAVTATSVSGAPAYYSAYGSDAVYGTYGASCVPASGSTFPVGTYTVQCSATNGGGKTGTAAFLVTVNKYTPSVSWNPVATIPSGTQLGTSNLDATTDRADSSVGGGGITYTDLGTGTPVTSATVLPAGTHTLRATYTPAGQAASAYNATYADRTITVQSAPQAVVISAPSDATYGDGAFTVTATGTPGGGSTTIFVQAGSACTAGPGSGGTTRTVTIGLTGAGSCVIGAYQSAAPGFALSPTVYHSLTVAKATAAITWAPTTPIHYPGTIDGALNATSAVPGTFSYTADGHPVTAGFVPDAGSHLLVVTFTSASPDFVGTSESLPFYVEQASQVLAPIHPGSKTYGDAPFAIDVTSTGPGEMRFETSGPCTVDGGAVTLTGAGTCVVSINQMSTPNHAAANPEYLVIDVAKATVQLSYPDPAGFAYGTALGGAQLGAELVVPGLDPSAQPPVGTLLYLLEDGTLAEGAILDAGTHQVTAWWAPAGTYGNDWEHVAVQATITVHAAQPDITWPTPSDIVYGTPITADQLNATFAAGDFEVTYQVGGSDALGLLLDAGSQPILMTYEPTGPKAANWLAGTEARTLEVTKAPQAITFVIPGTHTYEDDPFPVIAQGGPSGQPVTFATEGVCTTDGLLVTLTGAGDCAITASQAGTANYQPAQPVVRNAPVDKATPRATWAAPAGITFGTALGATQLNATVAQPGATGQWHYYLADGVTPADGAVLRAGDDQVLTATFVPDAQASANYRPTNATVRIDVAQAAQVITFGSLAQKTFGDDAFDLTATGGGSGLPVTFTATGPACTVNGTTVSIVTAGTCTITADQAGDADHLAAAPVDQVLHVAKAPQTIGLAGIAGHTFGDAPFTVDVTPGASGSPVQLQATGPCSVNGTVVSITGAGTCAITALQSGSDDYLAASPVTRSFTIAKAAHAITFAPLADATYLDAQQVLVADGGASGQPVTFASTGGGCEVEGLVLTITHAGTCTVTASQAGTDDFVAAGDVARTFTVAKFQPTLAWAPQGLTYGDPVGAGQQNAIATPGIGGTIEYSIPAGTVLDAGAHLLTVTFTPDRIDDVAPATATLPITVDKASQTITFGEIAGRSFGAAPFGLEATGGASGNPVTFGSGTAATCAVAGATVSILKAGGCTIAADQAGTTNFEPAPTVLRSFGIDRGQPTVEWATPEAITYGTPLGDAQLRAVATFGGAAVDGTFSYSPAPGTVLHASSEPQVLSVTFTPDNTDDLAPVSTSTAVLVQRAPQAIAFPAVGDRTYGDAPFGVTATGGASGQAVAITAAGACTIEAGVVTITAAGACALTADQAGDADHLPAPSVVNTFGVAKRAGSITLGPIGAATYGDAPISLAVTPGASTGAVTYAATGGCTVSSEAIVSIVAAGPCSVTAAHAGDGNHLDATTTQVTTIAPAAQAIAFPALAAATYGDAAFGITATGGPSGQPVTFTATGAACTVAGPAVTVVAAGTCTVTAAQAGDGNHLAAPAVSQVLTVAPATLTVTAGSTQRGHGQVNPAFAYTVTGFVNGDTATAITTPPTCTTTATTTSATGTYPITCSGAASAKYTFTYVAGTLTVGKVATRLTITTAAILPAGNTVVTATLTDALTGAPINGEPIVLTADLSVKTATSSPASASFNLGSGIHVLGAIYFGDANHWPAVDAQLLTSYQKTNFVIWGGNTGGVQDGRDYTFYGSQWSKQVKQGSNGAGSSFKGYASSVNAAGTAWTSTTSAAAPSSVGDVISVLVTTSTAKSGNNVSGNVTKQVLLLVDDADDYRSNGNTTMVGTVLGTL